MLVLSVVRAARRRGRHDARRRGRRRHVGQVARRAALSARVLPGNTWSAAAAVARVTHIGLHAVRGGGSRGVVLVGWVSRGVIRRATPPAGRVRSLLLLLLLLCTPPSWEVASGDGGGRCRSWPRLSTSIGTDDEALALLGSRPAPPRPASHPSTRSAVATFFVPSRSCREPPRLEHRVPEGGPRVARVAGGPDRVGEVGERAL